MYFVQYFAIKLAVFPQFICIRQRNESQSNRILCIVIFCDIRNTFIKHVKLRRSLFVQGRFTVTQWTNLNVFSFVYDDEEHLSDVFAWQGVRRFVFVLVSPLLYLVRRRHAGQLKHTLHKQQQHPPD